MLVREVYARSQDEVRAILEELSRLGESPLLTTVDPDDTLLCPAIRTASNLFEGEAAVSRVIAEVAIRRGHQV